MRWNVLLIILILPSCLFGQLDMEEGFKLLEGGEFNQAKIFFSKVLDVEHENKTASICYGRALGLSGSQMEALSYFKEIDNKWSNDFEIKLNLAEAFLWNKIPNKAKDIYDQLLKIDGDNLTANLGMANATASLKEYQKSSVYINRVLELDPQNTSALISRKYILLGLSAIKRDEQSYQESLDYLNEIKINFPEDRDVLLNEAVVYLSKNDPKRADDTYYYILNNQIEIFEALLGLSYTSILTNKPKKALWYAERAVKVSMTKDSAQQRRAAINKINALGVNKRFNQAFDEIVDLENLLGKKIDSSLAYARLNAWNSNFKEAQSAYDNVTMNYGESYDLHMGKAELYRAQKNYQAAISEIDFALELKPDQPDALRLKEEIQLENRPLVLFQTNRASDAGNNNSTEIHLKVEVPTKGRHTPFVEAKYRSAQDGNRSTQAEQFNFKIGDHWQIAQKTNLTAWTGMMFYENNQNQKSNSILNSIGISQQITKHQSVSFLYSKEAHNYTVDLIRQGIFMDHFTLGLLSNSNKWPGLFSNYIYTIQSDGNRRRLFFGSLYYDLRFNPLVKFGINYSSMSFDFEAPELYFSPPMYRSYELFFNVDNIDNRRAKFLYKLMLAGGFQKISQDPNQNTRRIETNIGWRFNNRLVVLVEYINNNAANTTAIGFSYERYGIKLSMRM